MIKRIITASLLGFSAFALPVKASMLPKIKKSNETNNELLSKSINCAEIIGHMEEEYNIPKNLLAAVAMVESKHEPFAVYSGGNSRFFKSLSDAAHYVKEQKEMGVKNVFVGPMQICLQSHGRKFDNVEHALNPHQNIRFAAQLLASLHKKHGTWFDAVKHYNASRNKVAYTKRVMAIWGERDHSKSLSKIQQSSKKIRVAFGPGAGIVSHKS
jgi:soluble lytic murein transglycosylase-like protein